MSVATTDSGRGRGRQDKSFISSTKCLWRASVPNNAIPKRLLFGIGTGPKYLIIPKWNQPITNRNQLLLCVRVTNVFQRGELGQQTIANTLEYWARRISPLLEVTFTFWAIIGQQQPNSPLLTPALINFLIGF